MKNTTQQKENNTIDIKKEILTLVNTTFDKTTKTQNSKVGGDIIKTQNQHKDSDYFVTTQKFKKMLDILKNKYNKDITTSTLIQNVFYDYFGLNNIEVTKPQKLINNVLNKFVDDGKFRNLFKNCVNKSLTQKQQIDLLLRENQRLKESLKK